MRSRFEERYPTIEVPTRDACPRCTDMAASFAAYTKGARKYELEERLRDGSASIPERIRAAWGLYGKSADWDRAGPVVRVPEPTAFKVERFEDIRNEPVKYTTFEFRREVTRSEGLTVTRVSSMGVTVEETYS